MKWKSLQAKMRIALVVLLWAVGIGEICAQDFTVGNLNYSINSDGTTVTVTGHVDGTAASGTLEIPVSVSFNGTTYPVTIIGSGAFLHCSGFTGSLIIPNSVTIIKDWAFFECTGFTGSLTIPNSVTTIGPRTFSYCTGFTGSLTIPNSVTTIEFEAFSGCSGFTGSLTIPNSVTKIGESTFAGCTGFTGSLIISDSVTKIGESAFAGCSGFTGELIIPNSVTAIDYRTFAGCSGFTGSLTIPNSVTKIEQSAFRNCSGFHGELTLPETLESVGTTAFAGCDGISTINYMAINCSRMGDAGNPVFYDCISIAKINIGENVEGIPNYAFKCCSSTAAINVAAELPPVLAPNTFETVSRDIPVKVPIGSSEAYRTTPYWDEFFNIIEENHVSYHISIDSLSFNGGSVVTSVSSTYVGEEVQITVNPIVGMTLSSLTVFNANDSSQTVPVYSIGNVNSVYGFLMPSFDVIVKAVFVVDNAIGEGNSMVVPIYPNPTNGRVTIKAEGLKHLRINNMLGQIIYEGNASGDEFVYDFSEHDTGLYLIRIETASGVVLKKVSVAR